MMDTYIKVNGQFLVGESEDQYKASCIGTGWHLYGEGTQNMLVFSDFETNALVIGGHRNLKSYLERVLHRVKDGVMDFKSIEIIKVVN